jgi:predicted transcriptional regulator
MAGYAKNSITSRRASEIDFTTQKGRVFRVILDSAEDGLTNFEIREMLKMQASSVSGRINDLEREGDIVLTKRTRYIPKTGAENGVYVADKFALKDDTAPHTTTQYQEMKKTLRYIYGRLGRKGVLTITYGDELYNEIKEVLK